MFCFFLSSKISTASSAARTPEMAMEPKIGPIRQAFITSQSSSIMLDQGGMKGELTSVSLGQLHTTNDHAGHDLTGTLDNLVLSHLHVETTHASKLLVGADGYETLDGEGSPWAVVTGGGDDQGSVDGIGVHAGLVLFVDQYFTHRVLMGHMVG